MSEGKMNGPFLGNEEVPSYEDPWRIDEGILKIIMRARRWMTIELAGEAMLRVETMRGPLVRERAMFMQEGVVQQRKPSIQEVMAQAHQWTPAEREQQEQGARKP